ncbi:hypothetical protein BKN14_00475 [Candidatus Gracilibacteria bacterium HOT-871]|nr:hypothetical protein BKN14_00475 [Candidatus Gracilibacteria bacterium HOT-871]
MEIKLGIIINCFSIYIVSLFSYLQLDQEMFVIYSVLLFIDYFTGLIRGIMHKNLKSKTAIAGIVSKMVLILLVFSVGLMGVLMHQDMKTMMSGLITALALAELYSIVGNIYEIRTGKKATEYDAITAVLSFILEKIKVAVEKIIKK